MKIFFKNHKFASLIFLLIIVAFFNYQFIYDKFYLRVNLEKSMRLMGDWFINNQTGRGDLVYQRLVETGEVKEGNHIVRQGASFYNMSLLYKKTHDPKIKESLEKGFKFFRENSEKGTFIKDGTQYETQRFLHSDQRYNNATALLLLALINYLEADANNKNTYLDNTRSYANYLLSTQQENGGFMYQDDPLIQDDYNNGESFYALIRMYQLDKNPVYLASSKKAGDFFIATYGNREIVMPFYTWSTQGFYYLYKENPNERYWGFMKKYTDEFIEKQGRLTEEFLYNNGSVAPSSALAVYLEGLIHVADLAEEKDYKYYQRLKKLSSSSLKYLLDFQINGPTNKRRSGIETVKYGVCIDYDCRTERIDATGHNLSAIYFYLTLL